MRTSKENDKQYVAATYVRFDLEIVRGRGSLVYDEQGKEYIDLSSGIATNTFGLCDEEWCRAVEEQIHKFQHTSNLYYSEPCASLAEELCRRTGAGKVFFSNSGAEANECAIKTARKWALDTKGEGNHTIITLRNSFHGRTVTTLAATGQDTFHTVFHPFTEGFLYADVNDPDGLLKMAKSGCAAIMLECVQGEGGVLPIPEAFAEAVKTAVRENDLLLIVDEVQTGNGRTGTLYAYEQYGFEPDIVTTAKGLGGGLPIGATVFFDKTKDTLTPGTHGSTFGGNPVSCAAALSVIRRIDDELLREVKAKSDYIRTELEGADGIKSVAGMGLMLGIETERDAGEVIAACMKNGVLPIKAKTKVRLLPALNIPWELLKKAVAVIKDAAKI